MKIYISGKISGENLTQCWQKFLSHENKLLKEGHEPVNPFKIHGFESIADIEKSNKTYNELIRACVKSLMDCDQLLMLPCWQTSKGAMIERDIALKTGIEVVYL